MPNLFLNKFACLRPQGTRDLAPSRKNTINEEAVALNSYKGLLFRR